MENSELVKDPKKLYWDERNNTVMRYLPISDRFVEYNSLWNVDKGGYNSQYRYNFFTESKEPFFDFYKQQTMRKDNKFLNLHPSNLRRNNSYFPNYLNYTTNSFNRFNGGSNSLYALNNASLGDMGNNQQFGIMRNDYSEDIDTIALAMKYPELGRITQFSDSHNIHSETWNSISDSSKKMATNIYGKKVLNIINPKSVKYNYDDNLISNANTDRINRTINIKETHPQPGDMIEEWIHMAQNDFYKDSFNKYPGLNIEAEAKVIADFIHLNNLRNDPYNNFTEIPGVRIFIGADDKDGTLSLEYLDMLNNVINNGYFTLKDLETYYKVGKVMSPGKFVNAKRPFERRPPLLLIKIADELKR
ncbi:MAG: hypothetical protein IKL50_04825 [Bacteroidales bacterium]|nr:hypothetical protein [Bacteroidales bacterium]